MTRSITNAFFKTIVSLGLLHTSGLVSGHSPGQPPPDYIADHDIAERVQATLISARMLSVNKDEIDVEVQNGIVTLRGCAESTAEKDEIGLRVKLIPGVRLLENLLRIGCRD